MCGKEFSGDAGGPPGMGLPRSLRAGTERGVYAASAWDSPCDVAGFLERCVREDGEAA